MKERSSQKHSEFRILTSEFQISNIISTYTQIYTRVCFAITGLIFTKVQIVNRNDAQLGE
ncbi:hypothetical protein MAMMFC1_01899 [Methylomusa anaerophila]|uniref:Uncharacterized protein n=1 Tax=Methylomusa anaerophila TaxID=1930071 RepID=A0A348AJI0_9FIRM|nr:hypothetical protein MAMMFC1_01899 [Methylomusa anaerophila]